MLSQSIKLFVLFVGVGVFTISGYCGFYRQVSEASLHPRNKLIDKNFGEFSAAGNQSKPKGDFGNLPLYFAVNRGQAEEAVKYYSMGSRYSLFLTQTGATMRIISENAESHETNNSENFEKAKNFNTDKVNLTFVGADLSHPLTGEEELSGKVNYFVGDDASHWQRNLTTFAKVRYKSIYPGIDALFYGNQRELEYDFIVAPRSNPAQIKLAFDGAKKVDINKRGELVIKLQNGEILQRKPIAYQIINGKRHKVTARFIKQNNNRIAFGLGKYDVEKELVIDPVIIFSTFLGGNSNETATAVKTDAEGNIYLTGATASQNFPTANPLQAAIGGNFSFDAFVTKINPAGNRVIYSTYLGGLSDDVATSLSVDANGNVVVSGRTYSTDFPTVNASQSQIGGNADGFITKLNAAGSALLYSTFLGGSAFEEILGASLDTNGNAVVVGRTESGDFPVVNPIQAAQGGTPFFRSVNAGSSWLSGTISPGVSTISAFAVNAASSNIVFAATNKGVFRSSDGGTVWSAAGQADLATPVTKIAIARSNPNIVYAVSFGTIYKSSNGGDNWTSIQGNLFPQFNTVAVDSNNPEIVFVGGSGASIYKTTNGGATWTSFPIINVSAAVNSIAIDPSNPQIIYVGTTQRIYKSVTGGGNWTAVTNGIPFLTTVWDLLIDSTKNTIYAATQNGLFKSSDAGANWSQVNANNLTAVRSLGQDPNNSATFYASTGTGFVFRSTDGGTSWDQNNTLFSTNGFSAVAAASNSILVGGYGGTDAFVARLASEGNTLNFSTYFGGVSNDSASGVRVDAAGKIIVVGSTNSGNFPTANAVQTVLAGGNDAFATKFNEGGATLVYSTFLGGTLNDSATGVAVDGDGNAYVIGNTISANFPVQNALQQNCASCSTFGNDAFITKLNANGNTRVYSTFLGGSAAENGANIEVDSQNRAIVVGSTSSNNFPVLDAIQPAIAGATDGFVSQIKADGSGFIYSTYFGASGNEGVNSVTIAPEGNAVIVGQTTSFNLPTVRAIQNIMGGSTDAFIAKIGVAADLEIVITEERDPVMVNNQLIYGLRVKNNGLSPATNVIVTDVLPSGVIFVSATSTQGSCTVSSSTLSCNMGNLTSNAQADIRLILTPTQTGTINNTATVRGNEPDPVSANNTDSEQTKISDLPSIFGKVSGGSGQSSAGVNINVEGFENRTAQTDAAGVYAVTELPLAGNYTVRPDKPGFYFTPRSRNFNSLTRDETADFVINPCSYTLSTTAANISAAGGNQNIFITANDPFCAWTATSNVPWISIASGNTGIGNGSVKISIESAGTQRSGTLTIGGQTFTVTQGGCSFSLMPFQQSFNQNGGTGTIAVTASQSFCQWTAVSNNPWITVSGSSSGTGSGTINYSVSSATSPRGGRIVVAGQVFPIWQEFNFCPKPGFAAPVEATVNLESTDIFSADFNSDGIPDLATVDISPAQISTFTTYIGKADGTTERNTKPSPIGPLTAVIAGDFNRDAKIDIAIAGSGKIAIYNGNGSGSFSFLNSFDAATGYFFTKIFVEDFNRDGKLDLMTGAGDGIYLYNGNGDGTFTAGADYKVGGRYSYSYAVGDLNGDGATDVVVGQEEDFNLPRLIYYFGSIDGTFSRGGTVSLGIATPLNLKIADFNGDGRADVVTDGFGGSSLQVFLWNSLTNGFRTSIKVFTEPFTAFSFGVADINNDGKPDIISASNNDYPQRVNIMRGNGNGTFLSPIGFASVKSVNAMTFGDFNRDGRIDLAFAKESNQIAVQLNECNSPSPAGKIGNGRTNFDFDGDGKADFSVVRPIDSTWYIQSSANKSLLSQQFGTSGDVLVPADYDGDGRTDIAVFRPDSGIWYRFNSSDNSFSAEKWGQSEDVPVPADYDGDERADLAVFRPENKTWYWLSSNNGQVNSTQFGLSDDIPVMGDYDGDTKADIAVFRPSNGFWYWLNSSNGKFQSLQFGQRKDRVVPADYDGDGRTDIAVFRPSTNTWYLMKSSLDQFFSIQFGAKGDIPSPADYDGDGKADFAVFRPNNGNWYQMKSTEGFGAVEFGSIGDKPLPNAFAP
jgi:uncharacterized repeat protein (TIGR01451 family)